MREELRSRLAETGGAGAEKDPVLNGIMLQFGAKLNARRQQALGISHYIWRSQDDNRVRSTHAARDDQTFSWDERLPGGFPGEDYGCRCHAEPVLSPDLCEPKRGLPLTATIESAAFIGYTEAARDFGLDLVGGLFDLAKLAVETVDYSISELAVLLGIAATNGQSRLSGFGSKSPLKSKTTTSDWTSWWRRSVACPILLPPFWITPMR